MEFLEWAMEAMSENALNIVEKNLKRNFLSMAGAAEKSFSHLREQAKLIADAITRETGQRDALVAILTSDEAARIYRSYLAEGAKSDLFDEVNKNEEPFFERIAERFSKFYLCDAIASFSKEKTLRSLAPLVCGEAAPPVQDKEKTVAFLRNGQASRAFECFAGSLGGVSAVYENNFLNACESVYTGQATYAIIPIYSTADGRLGSFYRQIEKFELSIVLTCDIDSDDGENTTTFALIYRAPLYFETRGETLYECKITFDNLDRIADISDAAAYYGVTIHSMEALPVMFSGRTNAFAIVFGLDHANVGGFFTYLALEYPQTASVAMYRKIIRHA